MKCYFNNRTVNEGVCSSCALKNECVAFNAPKQEHASSGTTVNVYL